MLTPLQARINIRTLYANGDLTRAEFDNLESMLSSSDRENHTMAMGVIEFKRSEKIKKDLNLVTGAVEFDILNVDPDYLIQISQGAPTDQRDKLFEIYLNLLPDSDKEKNGLLNLLQSNDQESTYLGERIIINKIRELQNSKRASDNAIIS